MKKRMDAEVMERRGRVMRVKFGDGIVGMLPADHLPPGTKISITVESNVCSFDPNKIWPTTKTAA